MGGTWAAAVPIVQASVSVDAQANLNMGKKFFNCEHGSIILLPIWERCAKVQPIAEDSSRPKLYFSKHQHQTLELSLNSGDWFLL